MKLLTEEKRVYDIAFAASNHATLVIDGKDYCICDVCGGTGLLPHPFEVYRVAQCYVCNSRGYLTGTSLAQLRKDSCGCNKPDANVKAISA